jgi:DnaJ-class molecular chaperone
MDLFIQVKKAYDILNDPQKRAIYDIVGMKGLKAEGWEVNQYCLYNKFIAFVLFIGCKSNQNSSGNS